MIVREIMDYVFFSILMFQMEDEEVVKKRKIDREREERIRKRKGYKIKEETYFKSLTFIHYTNCKSMQSCQNNWVVRICV